ncbi:hypothetical protein JOF41_007316 [Saccharothrix coeruleofusca]|uniref:hypothetical protein n=1 Tax=Saccharothrix coeruleofusca TaxID=33919 RepID=UPI001AEB32FB|nr:hypothetical protein [Saccharothrix coeruleofusca]MBP2341062.1 hypothetical protein [Saccharothrix coeruleofusca]
MTTTASRPAPLVGHRAAVLITAERCSKPVSRRLVRARENRDWRRTARAELAALHLRSTR